MAFRLLLGQLPLFAALVLTIWVPGHLLIDMALASNPNQADSQTMLELGLLVEIVFGPIYGAGIIHALAARMAREKTSYPEAHTRGPAPLGPPVRGSVRRRLLRDARLLCVHDSGAHPGGPVHANRRGRGA